MNKTTYLFFALALLVACGGNTGKAEKQQSTVKYETYYNDRYGFKVEYPDFLIPQGEADNGDGQKFLSEDQKIQLLVYGGFRFDFNEGGTDNISIDKAYAEDLALKEVILKSKLEGNHYTIEYKIDSILHTDYATLQEDSYFNIHFEYPEKEKEKMKAVIEHVISSFSIKSSGNKANDSEDNASAGVEEDTFLPFIKGFLNDCYWGKNINSLLRNRDKTLAKYIDSKMDVRRYYAPGTITKLGTRDEDFGFAPEDDFKTKPKATGNLIFEYVNDAGSICDLVFSEIDSEIYVVYYESIKSVPDVVVNNETFETRPVKIAYPNAQINAVYLPDAYNNPRGLYFINTPDGWKFTFVDDSFCGA